MQREICRVKNVSVTEKYFHNTKKKKIPGEQIPHKSGLSDKTITFVVKYKPW